MNYKKHITFIVVLAASLAGSMLIAEDDFSQSQNSALLILFFSVVLWMTELVPPFSVGLLVMAFLVYALGYDRIADVPEDTRLYTGTFSSSVIWLLLGGFFVASAMTKTGLDRDLLHVTMKLCGTKPKSLLFGIMLAVMAISTLISNTAATVMVTAALMPLFDKLGKGSKVSKALLLGITISATTGGMGTLIGSPPNAVAADNLDSRGIDIDFIDWMVFGMPMSLILTLAAWLTLSAVFLKNSPDLTIPDTGRDASGDKGNTNRTIVIVLTSLTVGMWLLSPLHGISAAGVSVIPLVFLPLSGVLTGSDIKAMGWDTLLLVAGGLSLGIAMEHTGLLGIYAKKLAALDMPQFAFFLVFAYATMLFSNIMSNTATCTLLIPLGMAIFPDAGLSIAMIIALSASSAMFLPVSTPPNAIAYSTGFLEQKDFGVGGILIGILGPALAVLWVSAMS